jgi:hypothetical protein
VRYEAAPGPNQIARPHIVGNVRVSIFGSDAQVNGKSVPQRELIDEIGGAIDAIFAA